MMNPPIEIFREHSKPSRRVARNLEIKSRRQALKSPLIFPSSSFHYELDVIIQESELMKIIRMIAIGFWLAGLGVLLAGASCNEPNSLGPEYEERTIQFTGGVKYVDLEGGFWGIVRDKSNARYQPQNLPDEMKIDGLHVRLVCNPQFSRMSINQWGKIIDINSIERIGGEKSP
jgi:hypothetical protein